MHYYQTSQGFNQNFYNGVSISTKLQEYIGISFDQLNVTGLYAEVGDMYLYVYQKQVCEAFIA